MAPLIIWFKAWAPWLPPKRRSVIFSPSKPKFFKASSFLASKIPRRTGMPVQTDLDLAKVSEVFLKPVKIRREKKESNRAAKPGVTLGSNNKTGIPFKDAATDTGTDT